MEEQREYLKGKFIEQMDYYTALSDEELLERIDQLILLESRQSYINLNNKERFRKDMFDMVRRLDILQELLDDPDITEIMVNSNSRIFIEKGNQITLWSQQFESKDKLEDVIQRMASRVNRIVNETTPIVDIRLEDGSRVNVVLPPVALEGPVVTIRKFRQGISMDKLIQREMLSLEIAGFLGRLVGAGYNLFISGGTSSGKTTFLNALSDYISPSERVITIEDSAELQINSIPNLVRMETRNANIEGYNQIGMDLLIRTALRMRPDRIIVGEVRGKEVMEMLQAMNSGHDGSMSTGHANNAKDMIARLEAMALMGADIPLSAIQSQIASAIDIIIHLERLRNGSRKLVSIVELGSFELGKIKLNPIYDYRKDRDTNAEEYEIRLHKKDKLQKAESTEWNLL